MRSERNVLREPGRIDITVAMPALNEERDIAAAITSTLAAFREYEIEGEVIVINDGSTDGTREIVLKMVAEEPRLRLINHDRPRGIGASFWAAHSWLWAACSVSRCSSPASPRAAPCPRR